MNTTLVVVSLAVCALVLEVGLRLYVDLLYPKMMVLDDKLPPVEGEDNLVTSANVPLPADTIGADPMLLPLADNGGRTQTHALATGSPAIDSGNNEAGLAYDQRGTGFPRTSGVRTDIGAFERQQP